MPCSESRDIHATTVFGEPGWYPTDQSPQERQTVILYNDRCTLSSHSLVCKAWLTSSRYKLFRKAYVRLVSGKGATEFRKPSDVPGSIAYYTHHLEIYSFFQTDPHHHVLRFTGFVSITSLWPGQINHAAAVFCTQNFQILTTIRLSSSRLSFVSFLASLEPFLSCNA